MGLEREAAVRRLAQPPGRRPERRSALQARTGNRATRSLLAGGRDTSPFVRAMLSSRWQTEALPGLHAAAGNRVVTSLLAVAQPKLAVGPAGDAFEREADSVAAEVVAALQAAGRAPAGDGRSASGAEAAGIEAQIDAGQIGRRAVDASGGPVDEGTERAIQTARHGGSPLAPRVRREMEGAFGTDFGRVRTHTGAQATGLSEHLGAQAFTIGTDIFFSGGVPDTTNRGGQALLAHELAHTIQQGDASPARRTVVQRWEAEGLAKANEIRDKKGADHYLRWPQVWRAMQKAGRKGSDLTDGERREIEHEYRTKAPKLDRSWLVGGKAVGLSRPLIMDIDGPEDDLLKDTTELSDMMMQHLSFFPRADHLKILNFLDTLKPKQEDTPEVRYWNHKMPQFRKAMKKHLLGTTDTTKHGAVGYMFSRGRVLDPAQKVLNWIEPGTLAEPKKDTLAYRPVDKSQMTPQEGAQQLQKNQVHNMEMFRFTSAAPDELKGFALITWFQRGAKKKATDFAKMDRFRTVGQQQEGFANPADLRPFFGVMGGHKLDVETKDLSAMPLWDPATGPHLSDIKQGVQGNCWALAALASMVSNSADRIEDMITDNGNGTVTCRFYDESSGRPEYVTVTKSVTNAKFWGVGYRIVNRGEITWPILILKAYASWLGSTRGQTFQAFDSGQSHIAFQHFTGAKASEKQVYDADEIKALVIKHVRAKNLVAAGSPGKGEAAQGKKVKNAIAFSDVQMSHAYSVIGADDKKIHLRNPWGKKKVLSLSGTGDFSLTWDGFATRFSKVYIGKLAKAALAQAPQAEEG